ncbi:hypothetical protein Bca52824_095528 [Brassica carinata]|uniref:Uncharacterized protein n=1 Tax=Brassica carinata TaxID=52824 RepID=A0A8X7NYS1_BRACI|nr:hypothetical protein Bca52824_095528 [Brassica carinata]
MRRNQLIGSKLVRSLKWAWSSLHGGEFQAKKDEFISTIVPSFYSCQCVLVLGEIGSCGSLKTVRVTKCVTLFRIKEVGLFFREFEPMSD